MGWRPGETEARCAGPLPLPPVPTMPVALLRQAEALLPGLPPGERREAAATLVALFGPPAAHLRVDRETGSR